MSDRKYRQVAFVANSASLRAIEQSVNLKLVALQLRDSSCEIKEVSCGAYIAPVPGMDQRQQAEHKGNLPVNLLWLATITYDTAFPANVSRDMKKSDHREPTPSSAESVFVVEKKQD